MPVIPAKTPAESHSTYADPAFLHAHIKECIGFYYPRCMDYEHGGMYHFFRDDGSVFDARTRHLVSTCRFIFVFSLCAHLYRDPEYIKAVEHGLAFLREAHRNPVTGGYAWELNRREVTDPTLHCYGHAFVLLAYAMALKAGVASAREDIYKTFDVMEQHFWDPKAQLYNDVMSPDWKTTDPYRGQNANMHSCEATLAAYEATKDPKFLDRAILLARRVTREINKPADGLIWEHYNTRWEPEWDYNLHDPGNLFRPPGYNIGHFTEWTKFILILERYRKEDWMFPTAKFLFDAAMEKSWDDVYGGMLYTVGRDGKVMDDRKYHWVHNETFAAAALLAERSKEEKYWEWYHRIWEWSDRTMIDHTYGAWFRILTRDGKKITDEKSPAGKTEYHPIGACFEVLRVLGEAE